MGAGAESYCSSAVDLFDEYWFFRNPLTGASKLGPQSGGAPEANVAQRASSAGPAGEGPATPKKIPGEEAPAGRCLLRTPSLPSRAVSRRGAGREPLRHSCSNLDSAIRSPPFAGRHQFSPKVISLKISLRFFRSKLSVHLTRQSSAIFQSAKPQRPPRDARAESIVRYVRSHHRAITGGESCRWSAMGRKKWRSLSDLEIEEVQGFKDLGFVFEKEAINASVMEVIPGLRDRRPPAEGGGEEEQAPAVPRPYLSEAWLAQKAASPPALDWFGGSSPADMKLHLRLWAQVVASNVRQEC